MGTTNFKNSPTTGDRVIITVLSVGAYQIKGMYGDIVSGPSETRLFRVKVDYLGIFWLMQSEFKVMEKA